MSIAALFMKNLEPEGISHVYEGDWTDQEKEVIDLLMAQWCGKWIAPGFNTWHLWKMDSSRYFVKRFTWDNFDINSDSFNDIVKKLSVYYGKTE